MTASKKVFQCDRAGHYVGPEVAHASPMEEGVFHVPSGCVDVEPPATWPDDKWPRWNGVSWDIVTKPSAAKTLPDAVAKLQAFLVANPDVAAVLQQGSV